jgi:predicted DNA-binding WGR domain protein
MQGYMNAAQEALLHEAARSPDGTILAIGYGRHGYTGNINGRKFTVHARATAIALERRGLVEYLKHASWGCVYRITAAGKEEAT